MTLLFGVGPLDEALADQHGPVLLRNEAAVEALPFAIQAVAVALQRDRNVVYLGSDRSPKRVRKLVADAGGDPSRLTIVDAFSALSSIPDPDAYTIHDPTDWEELAAALAEHSGPDSLVVVDSLSGLAMRGEPEHGVPGPLVEALGKYADAVAIHTEWGGDEAMAPLLARFPCEIHLSGVEQRIVTNQYYQISRVGGQPHESPPVLYRSGANGVQVYVPKIVVTGPADAGKTTFVHAVATKARSAERKGSTVAMDRGTIDRRGMRVEIFGTPGQERFDPIITPILNQAVGVILVVDATDPDSFGRASEMLERAWRADLHAVIAANKQDEPGALSAEEVLKRLTVPDHVPAMPCQATDPESALQVIDALIQVILHTPEVTA